MGRALEGEGYSVAFAYDGEDGLRLGKRNEFDVMLLDVMLPRMDGFTVIRKLREDRVRTQVIIVSRAIRCTTLSTGWMREPTTI